ncbi:unnamed protein product [Didymodactylos carnosus]|uniref:Uncharacterized protein n=1 Tax=Didymodactylos carnosus TaxID=1234261 RepID=A0A8S2NFS8_9BILA|nr:unnamed protein product [Didymodactylos carnosus]CAF3998983.1 unnamed protein product [Didymodactylos carnosus]
MVEVNGTEYSKQEDIKEENNNINMLFEALPKPFKDLYNHKCKYHVNDDNSITFYPSPFLKNDKIVTEKLDKELLTDSKQLKYFKEKLNISELESVDDWNCNIIKKSDNYHGFIRAIEIAFFSIIQSLLNQHSEKLRDKYVYHKNKKLLEVIRQDFIKGSKKNDYNGVINEFIEQIDKNTIPDTVKLVKNDFTTSKNIDDIATKLCIMDIRDHVQMMSTMFWGVFRCGPCQLSTTFRNPL